MSIFTDTMVEAIRKYRAMLRKYLPQAQRVNHLHHLDIKNPRLYSSEVMLYQLGYKIVNHLHQLDDTKNGYYSYSGISQFATHLQKFLDKYKLDHNNERVVHTSQLASRYMVKATQIMALSANPDTDNDFAELEECHAMVMEYSSKEQLELYRGSLQNLLRKHNNDKSSLYRAKIQQLLSSFEEEKRSVA
ncbi:MAG: hypothetical protein A3F17_03340 [Gammaproteobacteria bacterium RIFCSPHIGHO2_12_FULL_41_15]|nr:MAG: hypothetical protein A3F17_03340 [Gammaproteobacteria bacterium RIFCSPHIGHO2_12_FULL_41_15]